MHISTWTWGVVLTLVVGCRHADEYSRPLVAVRVQTVATAAADRSLRYSGRLEADTEVALAFKVGGYVSLVTKTRGPGGERRLLQAGDPVRRAQVLAAIRRSDYATRLDELRGMRDDTQSATANAKIDLERALELLRQGVIAQAEFDRVKAHHDSMVGAARAADARVGQADILLSDTELRSPLDGIVVQRALEVGDLVSPGKTGFIVADTRRMKVVFAVPDSVQPTLTAGLPIVIHTEALPGRDYRGQVSKIAAKADDKSRLFDVEATVANPEQALKVGMIATAELVRAFAATPPAVVPLAAIVPSPDKQDSFAVFVVERASNAAVVRLRTIGLGRLVRNDVTITAGLASGEAVVVRGANLIHDGERVAVIP